MARKIILTGSAPNDKTGDKLRDAFNKINDNFAELYSTDTSSQYHLGDDVQFVDIDPDSGTVVIQSGFETAMPVYIKGGNCSDGGVGGDVYIEAGGAPLPNAGTTGVVGIAAQQTTIDSNNYVWTFKDDGNLETPNGQTIISDAENIVLQSQNGAGFVVGEQGWLFDSSGKINVPSLFPRTFTAVLDTDHMLYPNPSVALDPMTDPWQMEVTFDIVDGHIETHIEQIFPILNNPGYVTGYTFGFTDADHGIPGYGFSIELHDVMFVGGVHWTANIGAAYPPELPATIKSGETIKLTADATSWTFGPDGILKLPGGLTFSSGAQIFEQADHIGPAWASGLSIRGSGANDPIRIYAYGADSKGYNAAGITVNQHSVVIYGNSLQPSSPGTAWTFESDGILRLPASGDIVDSNGDSVLGGGGSTGSFDFVSNLMYCIDGAIIDNSDLTHGATSALILPVNSNESLGSPAQLNNFYGAVEINTGYQNANTWTFDTAGVLSLPEVVPEGAAVIQPASGGYNLKLISNGNKWTFDTDGNLTVPANSTIKAPTDSSFALRSRINDAEPVNGDTLSGGMYIHGQQVSINYTVADDSDPSGERGGPQWDFSSNGEFQIPGIIRRSGRVAELNLGVLNSNNALLTTTDEAGETQLLLSALAGASLTSNHNVLISAGGSTLTGNIYAEAEQLWEVTRDEDAAMIVPATRPWAGMPSYLAYPEIMNYPGAPINLAQVSKAASDAYTAWQEEVAATNVSVSVTSNAWTFGSDGSLELPNGSKLQTYSGGSTGLTSASGGVVEINADGGNKTWSFNDNGSTTLPYGIVIGSEADGFISPSATNGVVGLKSQDTLSKFDVSNAYGARIRRWSAGHTNEKNWTFGDDGAITLPAGGSIKAEDNGVVGIQYLQSTGISAGQINGLGTNSLIVQANNHNFTFGADASFTFPDTTVQSTAFQDVPSHLFFVHPNPGRTFTATGTYNSPFATITAAITAAVTAGHNDANSAIIVLLADITENITLAPGIFLTSFGTGTHGSPAITGTVTVTSSTGTTSSNHYSISNLRIIAPNNNTNCIYFTGTASQKLFVRDMWIDAKGTGTAIKLDNTGSGSTLQLDIAHIAHSGTGDVYCIDVTHGSCYVTDIETSGAIQVAAVRAGCVLTIDSSELDATGDVVCETYGNGSITITNSIINNTQANGNGIKLNDLGGTATLGNSLISVPVGTGYVVYGITGTVLYAANNVFLTANTARSTAITYVALPTTWSTKS